MTPFLEWIVAVEAAARAAWARRGQSGQATAEYALVLLGAAAVALMLVAWATKTNRVGRLLNAVVDSVVSKVQ